MKTLMFGTLIALLCTGLFSYQTYAETPVNGTNVTKVVVGNAQTGAIQAILVKIGPKQWNHYLPDGVTLYTTDTESGHDEWSVYMTSPKYKSVTINLFKKIVTFVVEKSFEFPIKSSSNDPVPAATATHHGDTVNGTNVTKVVVGNAQTGAIQAILVKVGPKQWNHYLPDGKRLYTTETESGHDEWSVYMTSPTYKSVTINLFKKIVTFVAEKSFEFPIVSSSNDPVPAATATTTATTPTTTTTTATRSAPSTPRPVLSGAELNKVMMWISVKTSAARLPFCWRQSYGNTAGVPMVCQAGYEESSPGICSQKCQAGERGIATFCYKNCPAGYRDDGLYCGKPEAYTRGAGYVIWDRPLCEKQNPQGCEQAGAIWYPKCKAGFHGVVTTCSPDCPAGWEDIGVSCKKPDRARATRPLSVCAPGLDKGPADLICYPKCKTDFEPRGPVCWQKCPSQQPFDCGAGCATGQGECTEAVFSMVSAPIKAALQIAALAVSAGGSAGVEEAANADKLAKAGETIEKLQKLVEAAEAIKNLVQNQSFQELLNDPNTSASTRAKIDEYAKDFVDNFAEMTSNEVDREIDKKFTNPAAANEVKRQWALRHLALMLEADGIASAKSTLGVAATFDPSGISDVINAFTHPVCKDNTPFPAVHPLY